MIPAAIIALAQFAPMLMKFAGIGGTPASVVDKVSEIASSVAGVSSVDEAISVFTKNQEKAFEFKMEVMAHEKSLDAMYLADVQSARARDAEFVKAGITNHRANWMTVLAIVVVFILFLAVWQDPNINEYAKGIITLVMGRFLGYLDNIYNFEFGSTRSNKDKDHAIMNLTEKDK